MGQKIWVWAIGPTFWSLHFNGDRIFIFLNRLKHVNQMIKNKKWTSYNCLRDNIKDLGGK